PIWRNADGHFLPTRPCPRCGAVVQIHRWEARTLRVHGWRSWGLASWVSWCGHAVKVILAPAKDGRFDEIPMTGGRGALADRSRPPSSTSSRLLPASVVLTPTGQAIALHPRGRLGDVGARDEEPGTPRGLGKIRLDRGDALGSRDLVLHHSDDDSGAEPRA